MEFDTKDQFLFLFFLINFISFTLASSIGAHTPKNITEIPCHIRAQFVFLPAFCYKYKWVLKDLIFQGNSSTNLSLFSCQNPKEPPFNSTSIWHDLSWVKHEIDFAHPTPTHHTPPHPPTTTSRTDPNCHGKICQGNISPGNICQYLKNILG